MKVTISIAAIDITIDQDETLDPEVKAFMGVINDTIQNMDKRSQERHAKRMESEATVE